MKTILMIFCLLTVLQLNACASDPILEIKPSKPSYTANGKIGAVDVYVDCSGSMKGYVIYGDVDVEKAKQALKTVVPKLVTNLETKVGTKNLKIYIGKEILDQIESDLYLINIIYFKF